MFKRISKVLRRNILVGLVLVTPIGATILIANWLFVFVTNVFLTEQLQASANQTLLRAAALVIVLVILFFIGLLARSYFGRRLYRFGDRLVSRLPIINRIYVQVRHISEVIVAQRQTLFKEVAIIEYPRKGVYSIGFLSAAVPPEASRHMKAADGTTEFVSLFIPTTPNPTSGLIVLVPRSEVLFVDMDVTDAMKMIVSAGAVTPADKPAGESVGLLEKLESWMARDQAHRGTSA